jgi:hypothetical protein
MDRSGKELENVEDLDSANPLNPSISPSGRHIALSRTPNNVWLLDLKTGSHLGKTVCGPSGPQMATGLFSIERGQTLFYTKSLLIRLQAQESCLQRQTQ